MGGCDGWLLWVYAMGGCYGWMLIVSCNPMIRVIRPGRRTQRSADTPAVDAVSVQVSKAMAQFKAAELERVALKAQLGQIQAELNKPGLTPAKKKTLVPKLETLYREFARLDLVQKPSLGDSALGGPLGSGPKTPLDTAAYADPLGLLDDDLPDEEAPTAAPSGRSGSEGPDEHGFFPAPTFDRGLESVVEALYATGIFAGGGQIQLPEMLEASRVEMLDEIGRGSCALIKRGRLKSRGRYS